MASVEGSTHLPNHHFRISLMMLLGVVESEKRVKNLILVCDNMGHLVQDVTLSLFCPFTWVVCCYQPFNLQGGGCGQRSPHRATAAMIDYLRRISPREESSLIRIVLPSPPPLNGTEIT